jgi:bacteriocin biosynthesis cyclodehydratase domain-containing protein
MQAIRLHAQQAAQSMQHTLHLHPAVHFNFMGGDRVQVGVMGEQVTVQRGAALIAALLPLCDGSRPVHDIELALQDAGHAPDQVSAVLQFLRSRGCFTRFGRAALADPLAAQIDWLAARLPDDGYDNRLTLQDPAQITAHLPIQGLLSDAAAQVAQQLGFQVCRGTDAPVASNLVCIHCTDWDDHASALRHNQAAIQGNVPTLYAALGDTRARVGPFVLPTETPCYACFHHRLRASMAFVDEFDCRVGLPIDDLVASPRPRPAPSQSYVSVVASLIGSELLKYVRKLTLLSLLGRALEIDLLRYQMESSRILRLPRCPACGSGKPHGRPTMALRDLL